MIHQWRVCAAAAALVCWPAAAFGQSATFTPQTRLFVGYSFNIDFVEDLPYAIIADQPKSPLFSNGSGPFGFEASVERGLRKHLGVKVSVSSYFDPFRGTASYCQQSSCAVSLVWEDDASAMYFTMGPVFTARETKRTTLFAHALVGAVRSSSTFRLSGTNVNYVPMPVTQLPDTLILISNTGFGQPSTLSYSDKFSDVGLAASFGGGFDVRVGRRVQIRTSVDWDPTFLSRAKLTTNPTGSFVAAERRKQSHGRVSFGLVWRF